MKKNILVLLILLIPVSLFAQTVIEDRVEIDPQKVIANYPAPQYTPCGPFPLSLDIYNPRQAVWNGSSFWLDPYQQLFNLQNSDGYALWADHYYNIETTAGGNYFSITKLGGIDSITGEIIEPEEMGNTLLDVKGEELIGTGLWQLSNCVGIWEKENPPAYQCHFSRDAPQGTEVIVKITDLTQGGSQIYYHTFIEIPLMISEEGISDYMYHFYNHAIDLSVYNPDNCEHACTGGHLPSWVTYTVEIVQGQEYGSIHNLLTDESADIFTNVETIGSWSGDLINWFEFVADGVQPDFSSPAHVVIRYTPSDANVGIVEHNLYVNFNGYAPGGNVYCIFDRDQIEPGDTAYIVILHQAEDGTLWNFVESCRFEVGMIEGCGGGKILADTIQGTYFYGAAQPIMFVADSTILDTSITVGVRVGLIEEEDTTGGSSSSPINNTGGETKFKLYKNNKYLTFEKNIKDKTYSYAKERLLALEKNLIGTKPKLKVNKKGNGNNPPLPGNPTEDYCFPGLFQTTPNTDASVVVGDDECSEDIVVCENFVPQKFDDPDVGVIESLGFNSPWNWIDLNTENPKNTDAGEGCNEGNPSEDVGLTYIMEEIGPYSSNTPNIIYNLSEDIIVETCLDERDTDSKWRFKVKNVRVPIFNDVCSTFITNRNFIDLKDGTDQTLLSNKIQNCRDLKKVLNDLDWFILGPYSHPCILYPARYIFNSGIMAHEVKHYNDIIFEVKKRLNEQTFPELINNYFRFKNDYPCPEDALNSLYVSNLSMSTAIREFLFNPNILAGGNIKVRKGTREITCVVPFHPPMKFLQYISELDADAAAEQTYRAIKQRIIDWGRNQSWYNPSINQDCSEIN